MTGYISAPDMARKCGVTVYTLYRWIKTGTVTGKKIGGRWYVTSESAEKLTAAPVVGVTENGR